MPSIVAFQLLTIFLIRILSSLVNSMFLKFYLKSSSLLVWELFGRF